MHACTGCMSRFVETYLQVRQSQAKMELLLSPGDGVEYFLSFFLSSSLSAFANNNVIFDQAALSMMV